jgi:predicted dehydrogenase
MSALRFAAIGLDHPHIFGQVGALLAAGGELVAFQASQPEQASGFARAFSGADQVDDEREILEDESIDVVTCAAIPAERAGVGIRAMQHGKDVLMDKPGATTLEQVSELRRVQRETGRIYSVFFSERHESPATVRAAELVRGGAIGDVVQVLGLGPHRANLPSRPPWFVDRERYGGILCDIASHQVDQFLWLAQADDARITSSLVANYKHPEHPGLEDYGEIHLRAGRVHGLARVDWYTPDALSTWGDGRLFVLGTDGYVEVRKYCDLGGRTGTDHLFIVDGREMRRIDCSQVALPFAPRFLDDVRNRTETAMPQEHTFRVCEIAIRAELQAERLGHLEGVTS